MKNLRTSRKFKVYREVGKLLREAHPELFPSRGKRPPLKQGILKDLIALHSADVTATNIRVFLRIWTRSTSYLMSISRGGIRIGVGKSSGEKVEEQHRLDASTRIRERRLRRSVNIVDKAAGH